MLIYKYIHRTSLKTIKKTLKFESFCYIYVKMNFKITATQLISNCRFPPIR